MEHALFQNNWLDAMLPGFWRVILQFGILSGILYYVYNKFIRFSQADHLVKGLFIVLVLFVGLWALAQKFQFMILEIVFRTSIQLLVIGMIVIFQPELRRILLFFGQNNWLNLQASLFNRPLHTEPWAAVKTISDAVRFLSKSKTGALIVLDVEDTDPPDEHYLEMGTPINAILSTQLMLTIFHPNTPLHDGAMVIDKDNQIVAAGVLLPLTEDPNLSWRYGTRHRAAIGLTEVSSCACIVVSEETGNISFAQDGHISKLASLSALTTKLEDIYATEIEDSEQTGIFANPVNELMKVAKRLKGDAQVPFWKRWKSPDN